MKMAETLGSLVDKLTIKDIREFHLRQMLEDKDDKFSKKDLVKKLELLSKQKSALKREIDDFIITASRKKILLKDEKLKLYNAVKDMGRIPRTTKIGAAISGLACKNLELWHLEDEARRKDVGLEYIGGIKRKIDLTNQQRNDFIDKIVELFEKKIKKS
jgi:hypothetical protein